MSETKPTLFRPRLVTLESRDCPSQGTLLGGFNPRDPNNPANWDPYGVPDDMILDQGSAPMHATGYVQAMSIQVGNDYVGPITFGAGAAFGECYLQDVDVDLGGDLFVGGNSGFRDVRVEDLNDGGSEVSVDEDAGLWVGDDLELVDADVNVNGVLLFDQYAATVSGTGNGLSHVYGWMGGSVELTGSAANHDVVFENIQVVMTESAVTASGDFGWFLDGWSAITLLDASSMTLDESVDVTVLGVSESDPTESSVWVNDSALVMNDGSTLSVLSGVFVHSPDHDWAAHFNNDTGSVVVYGDLAANYGRVCVGGTLSISELLTLTGSTLRTYHQFNPAGTTYSTGFVSVFELTLGDRNCVWEAVPLDCPQQHSSVGKVAFEITGQNSPGIPRADWNQWRGFDVFTFWTADPDQQGKPKTYGIMS